MSDSAQFCSVTLYSVPGTERFYVSIIVEESLDREYQRERITGRTLDYLQTCLHLLEENAVYLSISFLVFGAVNLALDLFLLVGSCCKIR